MQLRFPLPTGFFPTFELSSDETAALRTLLTNIVAETRREMDRNWVDGRARVDGNEWKLMKSKERLHVYRRRKTASQLGLYAPAVTDGVASSSLSSSGSDGRRGTHGRRSSSVISIGSSQSSIDIDAVTQSHALSEEIETSRKSLRPRVMGLGSIEGTVDDLVYGLMESTAGETKTIRAFFGDDSLIDCAVLHTVRQTKSSNLSMKWKLERTIGGNRDCCYAEYVGLSVDSATGERFGYHVLESMPVRNCPAFDDNSIVRTHMSFCYLFRPSKHVRSIDIFMQGAFDSTADVLTAGGVGDHRSAMDMYFSIETALLAAEAKKLSALVARQATLPVKKPASGTHCTICNAKPGLLSSHLACQGCGSVICTKCRVKKVTFSRRGKIKASCCKKCIMKVKDESPFAGETIEPQQLRRKRSLPAKPHVSVDSLAETDYSLSMQSSVSSIDDVDEIYYHQSSYATEHSSALVAMNPSDRSAAMEQYSAHNQHMGRYAPPMPPSRGPGVRRGSQQPSYQQQMDLYNKMVALQMQADVAYNLANQNAATYSHHE